MLRKLLLVHFLFIVVQQIQAQGIDLTIGYGFMNYQGDLQSSPFTIKHSKPSINAFVKYDLANQFVARGGLIFGSVYGDDKFNPSPQKERNLSFRSKITEVQFALEYHFKDLNNFRFSPYVFGGFAGFHFNPYTTDTSGAFVFLKPFSTEGEGLSEYPDRKPYSLNQLAIPFGVGFQYRISCDFSIGAEFTERKLFTDYLDDVSKGYVDYNTLLKEKGKLAVKLAYKGADPYPPDANTALHRGNPKNKDWYYTGIITLTYHVNNCHSKQRKAKSPIYGCPLRL